MTQSGETVKRTMGGIRNGTVHVSLSPMAAEKLQELADDAGMMPTKVAAGLLEELLPTVTGVRMRLQITRSGTNGGAAR